MADQRTAVEEGSRIVTVKLGQETFGLPIERIEGIVPWEPPTRVPRLPSFVSGVMPVRGRVLPVIDLRARLGMEALEEAGSHRRIVLVQYGDDWVGYVVDSVSEVRWVPANAITSEAPVMQWCGEEFVSGIAQLGADLVILLRVDRLLNTDERKRVARLAKREDTRAEKAA